MTAAELQEKFAQYGTVSESTLVKDANGRSRGFAFVQLDSKEAANHAMQRLNGTQIGGRAVAVDWALAKSKFLEAKDAKGETKEVKAEAEEAAEEEKEDEEQEAKATEAKAKTKRKKGGDDAEKEEGESDAADEEAGAEDEEEGKEGEGDDGEEKSVKKERPPRAPDVKEGRTIFVRNLLYSTSADEVRERFAEFGDVAYCVLVTDHSTGLSRGSAFVQYKNKEAVDAVMREAYPYGRAPAPAKRDRRTASKSVLEGVSELSVHGRPVIVDVAVDRGTAESLKEQKVRQKDKRNLYLLNEGGTYLSAWLVCWRALRFSASIRELGCDAYQ